MGIKTRGLLVLATLAIFTTAVVAQSAGPPLVHYVLQPSSAYEEGCYGECLCPILQAPMTGTFELELLPTGGPLDTYAFNDVDFFVAALGLDINGSGFYARGGEFNELELDLQLDGDPAMHFSSFGPIPAGADFPDIDIVVSVGGMQTCFDYVLHIVASPAPPYPVLDVDTAALAWTAGGGSSATYDVVCGDLMYLRSSAGDLGASTDQCLGDDHPQTTMPYDVPLQPGEGLWFAVREDGGTYDSDSPSQSASRDPGIDASAVACP